MNTHSSGSQQDSTVSFFRSRPKLKIESSPVLIATPGYRRWAGIFLGSVIAIVYGKGIEALYQSFFAKLDTQRPLHIAVLHGGVLDDAIALAERVRQDYQPAELLINITGPVLGLHTGPRTLALCGYME